MCGEGDLCRSSTLQQNFWEMRRRQILTDLNLESEEGEKLPVHSAVLADCSPFFRALFPTNPTETTKLKLVPSQILREIVKFAYNQPIEICIESVGELILWTDYLDVPRLRQQCEMFVQSNIAEDTWFEVWQHASARCSKVLMEAVMNFILRNFQKILQGGDRDIFQLDLDDFLKLLQSDHLNVDSEAEVWKAAVEWIKEKPEERNDIFSEVLHCVRMKCLKIKDLDEIGATHWVKEGTGLIDLVGTAYKLNYGIQVTNEELLIMTEAKACRPRLPSEILLAVGGWSGGSPTSVIESYDCRTDRWAQLDFNDPRGPRAYHGLAVLNRKIYMLGGFNGQIYFNSLRCFDTITKEWREKGPMNLRRCYVSTVAAEKKIFAMGGYDGQIRVNSCEFYSPEENQWRLTSPMICQRSDAHAAVIDNKIYICGGFNGRDCMNSAEVYDMKENRWRLTKPMQSRRSGVGIVEMDGVIYALGGFNGANRLSSVERYDPRTDSWEMLSQMDTRRSNFGVETVEGKIYVAGGFDGSGTIREAERFDSRMNTWTACGSMNVNRSALYMCRLRFQPNIEDYTGCRDLISPMPSLFDTVKITGLFD